ncbi:MAG: hypothetical protein HY781_01045 [Chloroflexi bacterium]|nr:hypothetical protein [Chloroflexota bacterium]
MPVSSVANLRNRQPFLFFLKEYYEYALQREHEGKRFFEENAGRLNHAAAVSALKELAAEEQKH